MDFRKFNIQIVIRVIVLAGLALVTTYGIISRSWFFTPLATGILFILSCLELIIHLSYYRRNLNNFLINIKQSGFNATFPVSKNKEKDLFHTFNEIMKVFQDLSMERERQYQFLNTLTENIQAGLIAFNKAGDIHWMNPEAKKLLRKPGISSLKELANIQPELARELQRLVPGRKKILQLPGMQDMVEVSLQVTKISSSGELMAIGLLQNIHREMEIKEVESWQKLTRVMRHEIMNSMTPIVSLTEAVNKVISSKENLTSSDPDFDDLKESLETIENRSKGLVKFVNAYKDFSHIPELSVRELILSDEVKKVKALFEKDILEKKVAFLVDIKPEKLKITVDPDLFEQVLINLVKNSLEAFESPGGEITFFCRQESEGFSIRISDNGPGMDQQILDRIFIPFYTTKEQGTGIGLSLSRQIIQQHGGTITVSSSRGKGTVFRIDLYNHSY